MLSSSSILTQLQRKIPQNAIRHDNAQHDTHPLARLSRLIPVRLQHGRAADLALTLQIAWVHAVILRLARGTRARHDVTIPHRFPELIDHHALKHVGLVVDVVEDVLPEDVKGADRDHEAANGHPQAVGEGCDGEGDDKDGRDAGYEDDEALSGEEVEKEPHNPGGEGVGRGAEVGEPVGDDAKEEGDEEEVRDTDKEVGDDEGQGAVKAVGALLVESV